MNRILGLVVVAMLAGCGSPDMAEWCDDAGSQSEMLSDAGSISDAGTSDDPCSKPTTLEACGAALKTLSACCAGFDDYIAPTEAAFCEHVAGEDANPAVACKDMGARTCQDAISEGLCY